MASTKAKTNGAKSLDEFRAAHDKSFLVPKAINEAIAALGEDGWEYEADFQKRTGVSPHDFAAYREQFEDYYVLVGTTRTAKRAWAGSKKLAAKMREMA